MRVSDSVGWVWIVAARSSAVSAASTARAPSAISSPAPGPTIPPPSTRPASASAGRAAAGAGAGPRASGGAAARGGRGTRRGETQLGAGGAAPARDAPVPEGDCVLLAEARLDLRFLLVERRHLRAETDLHEEL